MREAELDIPPSHSLPRHLAVVMDGNGRWARARGKPRYQGHRAGAEAARQIIETVGELGIPHLSLFAFSSENWDRPASEVQQLINLFRRSLKQAVPELHANGIRVRFLGDAARFPEDLRRRMDDAERLTAHNEHLNLHIAAGYGGRWDILNAARALAEAVRRGELRPEDIGETRFAEMLSLSGVPEPDLFIRTGGERRVSNFFLWHLAYTELYFSDTLWPEFDRAALLKALWFFAGRERRYGKLAENLKEGRGNA